MGINSTVIVMNYCIYGGNEQSTHKFLSELMGKETLDIKTYGKSSGRNGNYSTNYQIGARELMMPDEVRMLDNEDALLFIRGERPIKDKKYIHKKKNNTVATISLLKDKEEIENIKNIEDINIQNINDYEIVVDEDIDEFLKINE